MNLANLLTTAAPDLALGIIQAPPEDAAAEQFVTWKTSQRGVSSIAASASTPLGSTSLHLNLAGGFTCSRIICAKAAKGFEGSTWNWPFNSPPRLVHVISKSRPTW